MKEVLEDMCEVRFIDFVTIADAKKEPQAVPPTC